MIVRTIILKDRISIQFDQFSINFLLLVLKIIVRTTQKCRDLLRDKKKKKKKLKAFAIYSKD